MTSILVKINTAVCRILTTDHTFWASDSSVKVLGQYLYIFGAILSTFDKLVSKLLNRITNRKINTFGVHTT